MSTGYIILHHACLIK